MSAGLFPAGRVTVEDVARRAGVSTATVSRAVNGTARVAQETLDRVQHAIDELGFRPTPAAQNLRQQRTRNIALVVPTITNPFFPELVAGVAPEITRRGSSLLLLSTDDPEGEATRVAQSRLADGILLVGSMERSGVRQRTPHLDLPVVAFDRAAASLRTTVVQCDNAAGARAVVTHLAGLGHRHIAHLRGPRGLDVADQRARGHRRALLELGLDARLEVEGDFSEESGYAAALRLLDGPERPTAVFAANDLMAIGALAAFRARGVRVPEEISVAGFDGIRLGRYLHPTLTTYAQPIAEIAQRAVTLVLDAVDSGSPLPRGRSAPHVLTLAGELVVGGSTSAVPS
ncbi:LacI family DNA-binding transcriptional regulator [Cellulomonas cellasea]|uniref:LacI family DNA-binding transcriptional regulator n=1 Tax=Cellulomonas cellasea TaxID=43670 RepID=UPI0025A3E410|nr:LacI family DNA-binding transcriptional regulator [Cellulomonas cellasea]MDM8085243.1 LacI family DNA-binding transcriptional regulator [Cellulomonas cellasea]